MSENKSKVNWTGVIGAFIIGALLTLFSFGIRQDVKKQEETRNRPTTNVVILIFK